MSELKDYKILGMRVDETSVDRSALLICSWANQYLSKYVCVSNVHMCMESYDNHDYQKIINNSDLVVPDGKPLALGLKLLGAKEAAQVRGADLTNKLLEIANNKQLVIGFYGGTSEAINKIKSIITIEYPMARVGCAISPPFHQLSKYEDKNYVNKINNADVQILFVGLGCPKQESWMAQHSQDVNAVMIGVGAVFDFLSGTKKEAPRWVQKLGLEWFFRLLSEPKRLWKRYIYHNPRFVWKFVKQFVNNKFGKV